MSHNRENKKMKDDEFNGDTVLDIQLTEKGRALFSDVGVLPMHLQVELEKLIGAANLDNNIR